MPNGEEDWCEDGDDCDNTIDSAMADSGIEEKEEEEAVDGTVRASWWGIGEVHVSI